LSDRIRYYWTVPRVEQACTNLLEQLGSTEIPLTLISQYLPLQYAAIRDHALRNEPRDLVLAGVEQVLLAYDRACHPVRNGGASALRG